MEVVKDEAHGVIDRLLAASGIDLAMANEVGWFVNGLAEALAYGRDEGLAFALEALLAKWVRLGLERNTAELVMRMVVREVGGVPDGITTKTPRHQEGGGRGQSPKPEARMTIEARSPNGGNSGVDQVRHSDRAERSVLCSTQFLESSPERPFDSAQGDGAPEVEDETGE